MSEEEQKSSGIGGGVAIFLSLVAMGIATYPAYELFKQSQVEEVDESRALVQQLERTLSQRTARLEQLEQHVMQSEALQAANLEALAAQFDSDLEGVRSRLTTSSDDWLFAEVEYLVRMANQRVLMERDPSSALQLLLAADRIVKDSEGLTAHTLRQALAIDIAALEAVEQLDSQGIYLELSALVRQVPNLKRALPKFETTVDEAPASSDSQTLTGLVKDAGSRLAGLIDFRRRGADIKPVLPPDQSYYLRQNLVLKLQIAQMALLEEEGEVYAVSLEEAQDWINDSFDDDAARAAMLKSLQELGAIEIDAALPDISGSLNAVRDVLSDFNREVTS